jgi:putative ABC transport system permease protein
VPWILVVKNLLSSPLRTLLTLGSLLIAVFLLCTLRSLLDGLNAGVVASESSTRLMTQSAVSLFVDLPLSYQNKIEAVPGVERTCKFQWFGGYYREPSNFFGQFGIDPEALVEVYPEIEVVSGSLDEFKASRTGCMVGEKLARDYGFKVGDTLPITATIFARHDGQPWEFQVKAIYRSAEANVDNSTMWFHYKYLQETLEAEEAGGPPGVGVYAISLEPGTKPEAVMARIDEQFVNGPQRVTTTTEAEFQRQFLSMLGSVPTFITWIGGGVLFAILLAVLNTMLIAGRERTHDVGIIKALGFTDAAVFSMLISESLILCVTGGVLGIGLAWVTQPMMADAMSKIIPTYELLPETIYAGLGLSVALGVAAGMLPAWQCSRLKCVDALRAEV